MAVIIGGTSSPYDYQPYNNNPPQVTISEWQLSPGASIAVLVCLPITALLFFMIGALVGIEREKQRAKAAAKKKNHHNGNQNGGVGQGGPGGAVVPPAPPLNGTGNQVGNPGPVGNPGQGGNPGLIGNPGQTINPGQAANAA